MDVQSAVRNTRSSPIHKAKAIEALFKEILEKVPTKFSTVEIKKAVS
jgi:hypothetical protein